MCLNDCLPLNAIQVFFPTATRTRLLSETIPFTRTVFDFLKASERLRGLLVRSCSEGVEKGRARRALEAPNADVHLYLDKVHVVGIKHTLRQARPAPYFFNKIKVVFYARLQTQK